MGTFTKNFGIGNRNITLVSADLNYVERISDFLSAQGMRVRNNIDKSTNTATLVIVDGADRGNPNIKNNEEFNGRCGVDDDLNIVFPNKESAIRFIACIEPTGVVTINGNIVRFHQQQTAFNWKIEGMEALPSNRLFASNNIATASSINSSTSSNLYSNASTASASSYAGSAATNVNISNLFADALSTIGQYKASLSTGIELKGEANRSDIKKEITDKIKSKISIENSRERGRYLSLRSNSAVSAEVLSEFLKRQQVPHIIGENNNIIIPEKPKDQNGTYLPEFKNGLYFGKQAITNKLGCGIACEDPIALSKYLLFQFLDLNDDYAISQRDVNNVININSTATGVVISADVLPVISAHNVEFEKSKCRGKNALTIVFPLDVMTTDAIRNNVSALRQFIFPNRENVANTSERGLEFEGNRVTIYGSPIALKNDGSICITPFRNVVGNKKFSDEILKLYNGDGLVVAEDGSVTVPKNMLNLKQEQISNIHRN